MFNRSLWLLLPLFFFTCGKEESSVYHLRGDGTLHDQYEEAYGIDPILRERREPNWFDRLME